MCISTEAFTKMSDKQGSMGEDIAVLKNNMNTIQEDVHDLKTKVAVIETAAIRAAVTLETAMKFFKWVLLGGIVIIALVIGVPPEIMKELITAFAGT